MRVSESEKKNVDGEFFSLQGSGGPPTAVLHFSEGRKPERK